MLHLRSRLVYRKTSRFGINPALCLLEPGGGGVEAHNSDPRQTAGFLAAAAPHILTWDVTVVSILADSYVHLRSQSAGCVAEATANITRKPS